MSKFILRKSLYKISSHLGREDLNNIKFLCGEDLPRRKLERVHSAFEVFCALEDGDFIDYGKTDYLSYLLENIGRKHLISKYPIESIVSPVDQRLPDNCSDEQKRQTRAFLVALGASFSEREFRTLANFFFDPNASALTYSEMECMTGAEQLFNALLNEHVIQPTNLSRLATVLETIGRNDLKQKVILHQRDQQTLHSNHVVNPMPETVRTPPDLALGPGGSQPRPSPTTPGRDCVRGSRGQIVSKDHRPHVFFDPASRGQTGCNPTTEQNSTVKKLMVVGNQPPSSSIFTTRLEKELQRRKQSEESLLEQVQQLTQTQKDQQELIRRLVREKKILEHESHRNPVSYDMKQKPHGLAVVIGIQDFEENPSRPGLKLEERKGCAYDIGNYVSTFHYLGYNVQTHWQESAKRINDIVHKIAQQDHSEYDSFVFCISSHGEENYYVFGSDSNIVDMNQLIQKVQENQTLSGKPKMFFIQACRAKATDYDKRVFSDGDPPRFSCHPDSDVFIAFASTPHHCSYRSPDYGSWFVEALRIVTEEYANSLDLQSFMTRVNAVVCEAEGHDGRSSVRQCIETINRLTKVVYFFPSS